MLNVTVLMGRATADPETRMTQNGNQRTTFTLAVDRGYGENKTTDFIPIVTWKKTAEFAEKYVRKGGLYAVDGKLTTRKYTTKDGQNRTAFEVVAENIHFGEAKRPDPQFSANIEPDDLDEGYPF